MRAWFVDVSGIGDRLRRVTDIFRHVQFARGIMGVGRQLNGSGDGGSAMPRKRQNEAQQWFPAFRQPRESVRRHAQIAPQMPCQSQIRPEQPNTVDATWQLVRWQRE
jgi:hypothetical protein